MTDVEALYAAARELTTTDLLPRLKALIPEQGTPLESRIGSHGKSFAAPLPWNDPAAMLYFEIHGDARRYESLLTVRLFGHAKYRPGADTHTIDTIARLPVLIAHGIDKNLPDGDLIDVTSALLNWPKRIRNLLDDARPGEEKWANAPGGLTCPYCEKPLQVPPGWTRATDVTLTCRRCKDADGRSYSWAADAWLGALNEAPHHDPDELATPAKVKRLFPHLRPNTVDVWAHRAINEPHLLPIPHHGTNHNGLPLFRLGDIAAHIESARHLAHGAEAS